MSFGLFYIPLQRALINVLLLKRIVRQMGLPQMRFHDLRHSYAVISIKSGDDIKTIQSNLGHSSAAFTLDVYGHCTEEMKKASANRMESYMKVVMNQ